MNKFNSINPAIPNLSNMGLKAALIAIAITITAALLGVPHSKAHADSPTPAASQPSDAASQALRRYTLQLLHILSDANANQWQRYRQAMPHCDAAPTYLDEIGADSEADPLDATLAALTADLCADLDQRLDEARTVGLLVNEPEAMRGYTLIAGINNAYVHLIDNLGRVAHSWQFGYEVGDAKLLDNGNLLIGVNDRGVYYDSIAEVDPDGNTVWKYAPSDGKIHHDFLKMPSGNVLMLARGFKTMEETIAAGANPEFIQGIMTYDYLIEVRPTGSESGDIVWTWSTWDYLVQDFDPSKPNYGDPSNHPELIDINYFASPLQWRNGALDWQHSNAIDYNPDLDQIMLSPRNHSELWIIDRSASTKRVVARGNISNGNTPPPYECSK